MKKMLVLLLVLAVVAAGCIGQTTTQPAGDEADQLASDIGDIEQIESDLAEPDLDLTLDFG
ncbi:MAG: hypothetical protein ACE5J7_04790 [Candidatus Aenigmatarchaeota archaeon]